MSEWVMKVDSGPFVASSPSEGGEQHRERGVAGSAREFDPSAVRLRDRIHDAQTESRAAGIASTRVTASGKALKYLALQGFRHARASRRFPVRIL
jgi:hypothetical protein